MKPDTKSIRAEDVQSIKDAEKLAKRRLLYQRFFIPLVLLAVILVLLIALAVVT